VGIKSASNCKIRSGRLRCARWGAHLVFLGYLLLFAALTLHAQTIRVDAAPEHSTNSIVPARAMGAGIDRLPYGATDKLFVEPMVKEVLSAGWGTVSYRQNTELHMEAWHWNPAGTWSDPAGKGYFTGNATPGDFVRHSYGYPLPHRGVTHDDGTDMVGYSRLTDGDTNTYWKSNPYLTQAYTGEDDSLHPQWIFLDLTSRQDISTIRIAWAQPYAKKYLVQYWTGEDPIKKPTVGVWQTFPAGAVSEGKGGTTVLRLSDTAVSVQYVRVLMTQSSNTCDTHGSADQRNCVGYAIREIYLGTTTAAGIFHDLIRHTPDQAQTLTYCSSVDPWHEPSDLDEHAGDQVGFDLFFTSGYTRGLPAMIPIAMLYATPEDSAAEISYIEKRGYPISYVEMGEEPDGHYTTPEDYAALYLQWATALHKVDPSLKLGGPIFTGVNKDVEAWADANGKTSWTTRFIDYLKSHGRLSDLAFFSFEHYPMEPCKIPWSSLYDEANLVTHITQVWREDGVPANIPMFITESNIAWQSEEAYVDIWGALWLADYVGAFLSNGGDAVYFFHYLPLGIHRGCNNSLGTFGLFSTDASLQVEQPLSQYFASQLINLDWVQQGNAVNRLYSAASDIRDGAGHVLVTVYAALRPDGQWSLLIVNKDQENAHKVRIAFDNLEPHKSETFTGQVKMVTFGSAQYQWHPGGVTGRADPDGPPARSTISASAETQYQLPAASITVLTGTVGSTK
jgi:F5/8 type C domain-containing protein/glycosyl hydrolase family 39 (putative alpha-L-iduronidase)